MRFLPVTRIDVVHDQSDYCTTLFGHPEIKTVEDGRVTVGFFASDKASVYRIVFEGMTETGISNVKTKEFWVQNRRDLNLLIFPVENDNRCSLGLKIK